MLEIRIGSLRAESHPAENPRYTSRILLLHGLWGGAWYWRHFGSFLAHRGWEVIAADLTGRPGSARVPIEAVSSDDYAADVASLLASKELHPEGGGSPPPIVIGHDLGGLIALRLSEPSSCRAVVALAPPFPEALGEEYRSHLRGRWWGRRRLAPPASIPDEPHLETERLQPDSVRVARSLLAGDLTVSRVAVPALVVAGTQDRFVEPERLASIAGSIGAEFAERPAPHWGLGGRGFEGQVDQLHRWLVTRIGPALLRLSGYEDLDEDPES